MAKPLPLLFGRFVVKQGAASAEDVRRAVVLQRDLTPSIAEAAILLGSLDADQVREVRMRQRETGECFGKAAEALEVMTADQYDRLEAYRDRQMIPLGDALVLCGVLTQDDVGSLVDAHRRSMSGDPMSDDPSGEEAAA